ncbi:MAG: transglycosylase domain-containing protein [Candidatus Peribacteria bacterium]|nr:MAG: transglycosylase domain-containing protein [Candidatus Peribacteria bacterium]
MTKFVRNTMLVTLVIGILLLVLAWLLPYDLHSTANYVLEDRHGQVFYGNKQQIYASLAEVPDPLLSKIVAIEDQRFYWHMGVDLLAIARATRANLQAGKIIE